MESESRPIEGAAGAAVAPPEPSAEPGAQTGAEREAPLIAHLRALREREDRGALAALRRGVGQPPGSVYEMYPHVARFLPGKGRWQEDSCFLIAALFALHPDPGGRGNLGESFRRAVEKKEDQAAVERRFTALLAADPEEFDYHLRHAVSFLRAREVAIDWSQLLRDAQAWRHPDGYVQRTWARSFWGRGQAEPASASGEAES